jgi:hypothetical protein
MIKEKRGARRQPLRYTAWVALSANQRHGCVVSDVSDSGARIDVQDSKVLPDHFVLLLTSNGAARRYCRVMWRKPLQVGVKFVRNLAEAAETVPAPQAAAEPAPDAAASAPPPAATPGESEAPAAAAPAETA